MLEVGFANYAPTLRWKKGEYEALATLDEALKDRLLPIIVLPPISARDIEANRKLSRDEFAPVQVGRLSKYWGNRPCLVDLRFIQFVQGIVADAKRLSAFLSATSKFGGGVIPIFDLQTNEYRLNVLRDYWTSTNHGLALRVSLADLSRKGLDTTIQTKLRALTVKPSDCLLLIDFSDADLTKHEEFVRFAHDWLIRLQQAGVWRRTIPQSTNYPERNPAQPNGSTKVNRTEWLIWELMFDLDRQVREIALFGDFGADNANLKFDGGGTPITHLRYAITRQWLVVRGGVPTEAGDGSIRQVAKAIMASGEFAGAEFSAGDELIAAWAGGSIPVGGASEWRKANMSHHWTKVLVDLGVLNGRPIRPRHRRQIDVQEDFFSSPSDKTR